MSALILAFAASFAASLATERWPPSLASFRAPLRALAFRLTLHLALFAAAFALSWRPWHAAFVVVVASFLFGLGNATKRSILGEPLLFSDFALVRLAIRHPRLYYAERLAEPRAIALFAAIAVATIGWFAVEPAILPPGRYELLLLPPVVVAAVVLALRSKAASDMARRLVDDAPDPDLDDRRFGLGGAMTLHWLVWRRQLRPSPAARAALAAAPAPRPAAEGPAVLVAIQCESFVDIAARGVDGPRLDSYRRLCAEGVAWGRCRTPAEGAYTMRAEFGFQTGLPTSALGLDAFDPYLRVEHYAAASMARRFAATGRRTVFAHPYDRRFFDRDAFMPSLGFERFVDMTGFEGAERFGPYISDAAVAAWLEAEIAAATEPTFLFVVTIENHGPWGPGRLPDTDDPSEQYARHLVNADRMLGRVAAALAAKPGGGLLCAYGDHAPARTLHPNMPDRRSADYVLWDPKARRSVPEPRRDLDIDALGRLFLGYG